MLLEMRLHDERMDGREEGRAETALEMLKDKMPLIKIIKYSHMSKEEIYALAKANDLEVAE